MRVLIEFEVADDIKPEFGTDQKGTFYEHLTRVTAQDPDPDMTMPSHWWLYRTVKVMRLVDDKE